MKKNKGFTLIELLAVIVVLAIIALIATPIVMNTIKNSKKGAVERSGDTYIKQVETTIVEDRLQEGSFISDGTYIINDNGNLIGNNKMLPIKISGDKPSSGIITIKNGQVESVSNMQINDFIVDYNSIDNKYDVTEKVDAVDLKVLCVAVTELSVQYIREQGNVKTGVLASAGNPYAYGVEYSCDLGDGEVKTFYVLEDGDTTTLTDGGIAQAGEVSLIMNMNINSEGKGTRNGNTVTWCKDSTVNSCAADGALEYLNTSTESWKNISKNQISLPTYDQLNKVITNGTSESLSWLVSYTDKNISYGFWTSTPSRTNLNNAVYVYGNSDPSEIEDIANCIGVRPVITISKTQLK